MVELPANQNISSIVFTQNNRQILKTSLNSLQLLGIIEKLPLSEFKALGCLDSKQRGHFAQREKKNLIKQAKEIQKVLDSKHPEFAIPLLDALIFEIKSVTSSSYVAQNTASLSQSAAISQIRAIITSIASAKDCNKGK